jgi:hypothetical protein
MEEISLVLVLMVEFNRDPATDDVVTELLQFRRFLADPRFNGVGMRKAAKRNLCGVLHIVSRVISNGLLSGEAPLLGKQARRKTGHRSVRPAGT